MPSGLDHVGVVKRLRKSPRLIRARQLLGSANQPIVDDRETLGAAGPVTLTWPDMTPRPTVGIVRDPGAHPRWTKYRRLLENNTIPFGFLELDRSDWLDRARDFDVVVGVPSCEPHSVEMIRRKYEILEEHVGIQCYPSAAHVRLYEDKMLEAWICHVHGLPFAPVHISSDRTDALRMVRDLPYPVVSKQVPSSGSVGVEIVRDERRARHIVKRAFSPRGRPTHLPSLRQKNSVYFQEYIPHDGLDLRVVVVGNLAQGFYRRSLPGDFRASGMGLYEFRDLPVDAIRLAHAVNDVVRSPLLAVDMVRAPDGSLRIVEFSPISGLDPTPDDAVVDGVPGIYRLDSDGVPRFAPGRHWAAELALRQFLLDEYLPRVASATSEDPG